MLLTLIQTLWQKILVKQYNSGFIPSTCEPKSSLFPLFLFSCERYFSGRKTRPETLCWNKLWLETIGLCGGGFTLCRGTNTAEHANMGSCWWGLHDRHFRAILRTAESRWWRVTSGVHYYYGNNSRGTLQGTWNKPLGKLVTREETHEL